MKSPLSYLLISLSLFASLLLPAASFTSSSSTSDQSPSAPPSLQPSPLPIDNICSSERDIETLSLVFRYGVHLCGSSSNYNPEWTCIQQCHVTPFLLFDPTDCLDEIVGRCGIVANCFDESDSVNDFNVSFPFMAEPIISSSTPSGLDFKMGIPGVKLAAELTCDFSLKCQTGYWYTQRIVVDTSCSVPLVIGNTYGNLEILGYSDALITDAPSSSPSSSPSTSPSLPPSVAPASVCENFCIPEVLNFAPIIGGNCSSSDNDQHGLFECIENSVYKTDRDSVFVNITCVTDSGAYSQSEFDGDNPNSADYSVGVLGQALGGNTWCQIETGIKGIRASGIEVQTLNFYTDCEVPLSLGDSFGSLKLIGTSCDYNGTTIVNGVEPIPSLPSPVDDICETGSHLETLNLRLSYSYKACLDSSNYNFKSSCDNQCFFTYTYEYSDPAECAVMGGDCRIEMTCESASNNFNVSMPVRGFRFTMVEGESLLSLDFEMGVAGTQLDEELTCEFKTGCFSAFFFYEFRQQIVVDTSCSQPLIVGDTYGAFTVLGYTSASSTSAAPSLSPTQRSSMPSMSPSHSPSSSPSNTPITMSPTKKSKGKSKGKSTGKSSGKSSAKSSGNSSGKSSEKSTSKSVKSSGGKSNGKRKKGGKYLRRE